MKTIKRIVCMLLYGHRGVEHVKDNMWRCKACKHEFDIWKGY